MYCTEVLKRMATLKTSQTGHTGLGSMVHCPKQRATLRLPVPAVLVLLEGLKLVQLLPENVAFDCC